MNNSEAINLKLLGEFACPAGRLIPVFMLNLSQYLARSWVSYFGGSASMLFIKNLEFIDKVKRYEEA